MQEIERANPDTLYRVFGAADWGNKEKFTDELLKDLIEGFSSISLGNTAVDTDILGDAYEYLVGKFADVTRRNKAGEFYTPRSVVRMMVEILDPKEGESIYDPACGTGGMLLAAIDHVKRAGGDPRTFFGKVYGQEKNLTTSSVARMNLVLHGIEDFQIAREDTLRDPAGRSRGWRSGAPSTLCAPAPGLPAHRRAPQTAVIGRALHGGCTSGAIAVDGAWACARPARLRRPPLARPRRAAGVPWRRRYQPSEARPSTPLEVPPNVGLSRRCASTPSSKFRLSRSSTPRL